jgi:isoamylase
MRWSGNSKSNSLTRTPVWWHSNPGRRPTYTLAVRLAAGHASPLGATWDEGGGNFALWSAHATNVELCLFDSRATGKESTRIMMPGHTGDVWHAYVADVRPGQVYGYRVHGPWDPARGHRFNAAELLFDPYARAVGRQQAWSPWCAPLAAVVDSRFDWGNDGPPGTPWTDTVIYELHVKGFTALHPGVAAADRGTYRGLGSDAAIAHLLDLGVTAVELMPVHARVDERALHQRGLTNYWGYNTLGYFAPEPRLAASPDLLDCVSEFKAMVKALHTAGLEVILDVVYNHTAEGNHEGPTLSMRGIDNANYYRLRSDDRSRYQDFTGCGNTLNTRTPAVRQLILDSLRYWVDEMHVDGFRFDLASALVRSDHAVDLQSPLLDDIAQDPVLSKVKLIAEPWDATADGYLVGHFPAGWSEWNGMYRDTLRRTWRGYPGQRADLATRLAGSSDLYRAAGRTPQASVNFITAHDGFTLTDLVSYQRKHNEANGEDNRDGEHHNASANWGAEGPSTDTVVLSLRARLKRSMLLSLCVSQGVPMLGGGDETGRTQHGNNNAYCHDSPISWTEWPGDQSLLAFTRRALALRRAHPLLRRSSFFNGGDDDVVWLTPTGLELSEADWQDADARALGMWLRSGAGAEPSLLVLLNPGEADVDFHLPALPGGSWTLELSSAEQTVVHPDVPHPFPLTAHSAALFRCG